MAWLTSIITLPLTVFAVLFALSNRDKTDISLWPFESVFTIPEYLLGLGMLGLGFFSGAVFVWILSQKTNFQYWKERRRTRLLEKDLEKAQKNSAVQPQQALLK